MLLVGMMVLAVLLLAWVAWGLERRLQMVEHELAQLAAGEQFPSLAGTQVTKRMEQAQGQTQAQASPAAEG